MGQQLRGLITFPEDLGLVLPPTPWLITSVTPVRRESDALV